MDQWKTTTTNDFEPRQGTEVVVKDAVAARKVQKADREKLRRDRLNEQFVELGNVLDPDRPKNDKATIIIDSIQTLMDLTAEVSRLKAECASLSEESHELTQEKNELREEKVSLKSDIDNLNVQYQQRLSVMFPWGAMDPTVVMAPPYSYPVALPVPQGPTTVHPFPFFGNQNPGIPNTSSTYIPYPSPVPNPHHIDQPPSASTSHISGKQECGSKSSGCHKGSNEENGDSSIDVGTELELKIPGSTIQQELPPRDQKGKQAQRKEESIIREGSFSSRHSSRGFQDSSSNSMGDIPSSNNS
ncbi:hypothetical protein LguiA_013975 [Lonicera macranthoides]